MRINEGQAVDLLSEVFGLQAPVAFVTVKKTYRRLVKELHPDQETGDEDRFKAVSDGWDKLKALYDAGSSLFSAEEVIDEAGQVVKFPTETVDGTPLSDLGLGLGPITNGRDCSLCKSQGYTIVKEHGPADCDCCGGTGLVPKEFKCNACKGTGKFKQKNSGRIVDCRVCHGTGKFKHPKIEVYCDTCHATGKVRGKEVTKIYALKCHACKGTGETEVWNPVLPKGRLMGTVSEMSAEPTFNAAPEGHGPRKAKKSRKINPGSAEPVSTTPTEAALSELMARFR